MSGARAPESTRTKERIALVEHQLAVAQQITHIGSWEWDLATNAVTWSDELYRVYGLEPRSREIDLGFFLSCLHPGDRDRVQGEVRAAVERGGRFAWVERVVRPDGAVRVLDTIGEVTAGEDGKPRRVIGTCRDVTEERKRDEQLQRYADIVRNVQIGLSVWNIADPEDVSTFRLVAFNPAAERLAGTALQSEMNKALREVVPYAPGGQLETLLREVGRDGQVREAVVQSSRDPRNPNRALSMKAFALPGSCVGVAFEDITAPTVARRLQEAEHRVLEMIGEGAPLAAVLETLVLAIEAHSPPVIAAIHLLESDSWRYPQTVAPSLREPLADPIVYASALIHASDGRELGELVLYVPEERPKAEGDVGVLERAVHLARIAIERRQLEDQQRALSAHVESIREDERTVIAREIHDEFGQVLTALKMDIAWILRRSVSESITVTKEALVDKLVAMSKMTDDAIQQVRRISSGLRPGVLDDLGLVAAIEWQAQDFEARTGTTCRVRVTGEDPKLERATATPIFRIFQEALTNVTRHAKARHVDVRLHVGETGVELDVRDDGIGITPEALRSPRSLGLLGVRERAQRLGGSVVVASAPPRGTLLALRVPVSRVAR